MEREKAIETVAVPSGTVWSNDHTGWVAFGAEIVTALASLSGQNT